MMAKNITEYNGEYYKRVRVGNDDCNGCSFIGDAGRCGGCVDDESITLDGKRRYYIYEPMDPMHAALILAKEIDDENDNMGGG
jgi:hypothetical protein